MYELTHSEAGKQVLLQIFMRTSLILTAEKQLLMDILQELPIKLLKVGNFKMRIGQLYLQNRQTRQRWLQHPLICRGKILSWSTRNGFHLYQ